MYAHKISEDLSELFMEYYKSDWKKRSEAAKILGYIKDPDEINKLTPYIIELAQDNNKITKINLINSIKKIILDYNIINEDLFVLLCCWANSSSNSVVLEMAKRIINSLDLNYTINYILSLSKKLYSSNLYVVAYALISLGMISTISPEHLTNTLPEIIMLSNRCDKILIQILAIEVLEEFKHLEKEHTITLFFQIYRMCKENDLIDGGGDIYKDNQSIARSENLGYLVYMCLKKDTTTEEIRQVIKGISHYTNYGVILGFLGLYTHFKTLKDLMHQEPTLFKELLNEIMNNIKKNNSLIKISSMLLFSKLLIYVENENNYLKEHITEGHIGIFFNEIYGNLNSGNYLSEGYSLEVLYRVFKNIDSEYYYREKIKDIVNSIDLEHIMNKGYLSYYYGIYLSFKLTNKIPSIKSCPYYDINIIEELSSMEVEEYKYLLVFIKSSTKRSFWLGGWADRFYAGKYLGNLLYEKPGYIDGVFDSINSLILDNNYIVRCVGIWVLRVATELGALTPEDILINSIISFDDHFYECRLESALLWKTLLDKFPNILFDNEKISKRITYELISKYLVEECEILRSICLNILQDSGMFQKFPELMQFKNFNDLSKDERKKLFKDHWDYKVLRKAIAVSIKLILKKSIINKDYDTIKEYLEFINDLEIHREIFYMLYEIIQLKEEFKIAENIINNIRNKHKEIPHYLEEKLFHNICEPLISIRSYKLRRLLSIIKEGFYISYDLLNRVKEIAIYECISEENERLALSILAEMNEYESNKIINEKIELMNYLGENSSYGIITGKDVKSLEDMDWKDLCILISYIPTEGKVKIFEIYNMQDILNKFINTLEERDRVIIKVRIIDFLISEIYDNDELLEGLFNNKKLFAILFNLYSNNQTILAKRALSLLEELSLLKENWLKDSIIEYYSDNEIINKKSLKYLSYMLNEDLSSYFKITILEAIKYITENRLKSCSHSCHEIREILAQGKLLKEDLLKEHMNLKIYNNNVVCFDMDYIYTIVNSVFGGDIKKQSWVIIKNTLDILIFSSTCLYTMSDEKIMGTIIRKLLEYSDELNTEERSYLYIYLKKLLELSGYNIENLENEYIEKFFDLEYTYLQL